MGKYLFFDIDGTLVGSSKKVTKKNKWAIDQVRKNGNKVFLCTGRAPVSVFCDDIDIHYDGVVCSAGGYVIIDGEYIYENFINQYVLSEVMTLFVNNHILFTLETKNTIYYTPGVNEFFDKKNEKVIKNNPELARLYAIRKRKENKKPIKDFDILTTGVTKLCFIAGDKEEFYNCQKFLDDFFHVVLFSKETDDFINGEIILKHCTKADGIKKVIQYYKDSMKNTIGFGDSMNDYQMIKEVETGVVYKNAVEPLKELADYYFDDPDDDGIYKVLLDMNLIESE